nr:unnamed protein product [Naegleria fowleri]
MSSTHDWLTFSDQEEEEDKSPNHAILESPFDPIYSVYYCGNEPCGTTTSVDLDVRFGAICFKPSHLIKEASSRELDLSWYSGAESDEPLIISRIVCGGYDDLSYSLLMQSGDNQHFLVTKFSDQVLTRYKFKDLIYPELEKTNYPLGTSFEVKEIICSSALQIIFEMSDLSLWILHMRNMRLEKFEFTFRHQIEAIGSGIMSQNIVVVPITSSSSRQAFLIGDQKSVESITLNLTNSPVKLISQYAFELIIFVHQNNKMYIYYGGTEFSYDTDGCGFNIPAAKTLVYVKTQFEEMCPISHIACGYSHVVVLLENGDCFCRGLNNFNQVSLSIAQVLGVFSIATLGTSYSV